MQQVDEGPADVPTIPGADAAAAVSHSGHGASIAPTTAAPLNLRRLRYFVTVARLQNFSRAADLLYIAQSPLSQQIRRLEEELGVRLLDRTTRQVTLTPAGRALYARGVAILDDCDAAVIATKFAAEDESGTLSIGFPEGRRTSIPEVVRAYSRLHPKVALSIHANMSTAAHLEHLHSHRVDVAIMGVTDAITTAGLVVHPIEDDPVGVIVPASNHLASLSTVRAEQLVDEPFIGYPAATMALMNWAMNSIGRAGGFSLNIAQLAEGVQTHVALVSAGLGISIATVSEAHDVDREHARFLELRAPRIAIKRVLAYSATNRNPNIADYVSVVLGMPRVPISQLSRRMPR